MKISLDWQVEYHDTLPSTNDYCIEQAEKNHRIALAVLAGQQTAPRATRGRPWVEPPGNLALSVLLYPDLSLVPLYWWSFIAALAFYDAANEYVSDSVELKIKWPNDLLYQGKKLGGILIESKSFSSEKLEWLVIGFGMNIKSKPHLCDREVACLAEFSQNLPSIHDCSSKILLSLSYWQEVGIKYGFSPLQRAWLERSFSIGTVIAISVKEKKIKGLYQGIDDQGFLLLQTEEGLRKFSVGEVFLLE